MKRLLLSLVLLPVVVANTSEITTEVESVVSGESASARTEIRTVVNGEETYIESNEPGTIKVEVKNGEVKVETTGEASPTVSFSPATLEEIIQKREGLQDRVLFLVKEIFFRFSRLFRFQP